MEGKVAGGTFSNTARVDLGKKGLAYSANLNLQTIQADPLLTAFLPKAAGNLEGVMDLALFLDLSNRCGMIGIQEWLSFYFKSPMCAPELYPEHDLFIQLMKLKNTLRHVKGEEMITHLGLEYYD